MTTATVTTAEFLHAQASAMTERDLLEQCRAAAKTLGLLCYHTHDSRRSEPGFPDLVIVGRRGVLIRELKRQRGTLTSAQSVWLDALEDAGVSAGVWRPADLIDGTVLDQMRAVR